MPRKGFKTITVSEDVYAYLEKLARECNLKSIPELLKTITIKRVEVSTQ